MRTVLPPGDYVRTWDVIADRGLAHLNLDVRASGRRYLSLATVCLTAAEARELESLTHAFARLLDTAVDGILADRDWWSALAWPWPAIELARQEPAHPGGLASLFGRFDCLLEADRGWQVIEYNADTPSGGREASGLEPAVARLYPGLRPLRGGLSRRLTSAIEQRIARHERRVGVVGVVSSHSWIEDMAQATWLAWLLQQAGQAAFVGDINDLSTSGRRILLRGQPIEALYRFYPVERLYRHAIFASLCEAVIAGRLLVLNGLRGFVAQSKACLAWLWAERARLPPRDRTLVERHLPATLLARDAAAADLLPCAVVKHVNGREGDSVVFGRNLSQAEWESRLLEGGYVVQRAVSPRAVSDVLIDVEGVHQVSPRYACVGAFAIAGRFGGCYTRLDGPVTSAQATYAATLRER